jgi:hypothetical protein
MSANLENNSRVGRSLVVIDFAAVRNLLPQCNNSVRHVARVLGISQSTLHWRLRHEQEYKHIHAERNTNLARIAFLRHQGFVRRVARKASLTYQRREIPRLIKLEIGIGREFCVAAKDKIRTCNNCFQTLPLAEFYFKRESQVYRRKCKSCCRVESLIVWHERGARARLIHGRRRATITKLTRCYPYLLSDVVDGAQLIQRINNLVPRYLSEDVRADVCQEVALAVLSDELDLANLAGYIKQYIKSQSAYLPSKYEKSLDAPLNFSDGHKYSPIDTISTDDYNNAWGVKNHYGHALSDCENTEDLAERLSDAWEANRLKTLNRKTYSRFSAKHEDDNRGLVAPAQVSGRVGMYRKFRHTIKLLPRRDGIERKLDELSWATEDYLEQRRAEEISA